MNKFLLTTSLLVLLSCSAPAQDECVKNKDINTLQIDSLEANAVVLDVRTQAELNRGYLENAVHIDIKSTHFMQEINKLDKDKTYYIYCHAGGRSSNAASKMCQAGFKNVYNLRGGLSSWKGKTVK